MNFHVGDFIIRFSKSVTLKNVFHDKSEENQVLFFRKSINPYTEKTGIYFASNLQMISFQKEML